MKHTTLSLCAMVALLFASCTWNPQSKVDKLIDIAHANPFESNEKVAQIARERGYSMAMVLEQEDTSSVVAFTPGKTSINAMTYVRSTDAIKGVGGDYRLDGAANLTLDYKRTAADRATIALDGSNDLLQIESIARQADTLSFVVPVDGSEPFHVKLLMLNKPSPDEDPLADPAVRRILIYGLSLSGSDVDTIGSDTSWVAESSELEDAFASADSALAAASEDLANAVDSLNVVDYSKLSALGNRLGFNKKKTSLTGNKLRLSFKGAKCTASECRSRMAKMQQEALAEGFSVKISHTPLHSACRFEATMLAPSRSK